MSNDAKKAQILELLDRLFRSWWTVVAGICIGLAGALISLNHTPKVYEASTTIFVAPRAIPGKVVQETVIDDMGLRMSSLRDAVLSRPYLQKLVEEAFVPPRRSEEEVEMLIAQIRGRVSVKVARAAFEISYKDQNPAKAATVANFLADQYIEENANYVKETAADATALIQEMADRVRAELDIKESQIASYRSAHAHETDQERETNMRMLESRQRDLENQMKELKAAQIRLRALSEIEADTDWLTMKPTAETSAGSADGEVITPEITEIQSELSDLRRRYADKHPDVQAKMRELDEAKKAAKASGPVVAEDRATISDTAIALGRMDDPVEDQRPALEREVQAIQSKVDAIEADILVYEARLSATPRVEQRLAELSKGIKVQQRQYEDYLTQLEGAKSAEMVHEASKGERFEIIERAVVPRVPVQPVPMMVIGIGLAIGLVAFVGPLALKELSNPIVRSETGLAVLDDLPVLATIPRVATPSTAKAKRMFYMRNIGLSAASVLALVAVILLKP
ncbi:hypothetical protein ABI59_18800 [Acidobacteria bacterium Mor1]|nr:hypothetical protein ABI59_18800 [Acidobacteria bacterium Mor1]